MGGVGCHRHGGLPRHTARRATLANPPLDGTHRLGGPLHRLGLIGGRSVPPLAISSGEMDADSL